MGGGVIKELVDAEEDVGPRAGGDGGSDGADGGLHGVVDGAGIIIEEAGEFLAEFDLDRGELANVASVLRKLLCLAISWDGVGVWRVLGFLGCWMAK